MYILFTTKLVRKSSPVSRLTSLSFEKSILFIYEKIAHIYQFWGDFVWEVLVVTEQHILLL